MPVTVVANTSVSNPVSPSRLRFIGRRHASKLTPGVDSFSRHRRYVLLQRSLWQFIAKFAVNLTDPVFRGIYHGKVKHQGLHLHHFLVIKQPKFCRWSWRDEKTLSSCRGQVPHYHWYKSPRIKKRGPACKGTQSVLQEPSHIVKFTNSEVI